MCVDLVRPVVLLREERVHGSRHERRCVRASAVGCVRRGAGQVSIIATHMVITHTIVSHTYTAIISLISIALIHMLDVFDGVPVR